MANAADVAIGAKVLPDEIAKRISGSMTVTPADSGDKWYYKLTSVTTTSADLIAGQFLDYTAVDQDTKPSDLTTSDKVKFLLIKNTSSTDGIVISIDGGTAAYDLADGIFIGASETWCARLPQVTVGNIHAISADIDSAGDASATVIVVALIDDVA